MGFQSNCSCRLFYGRVLIRRLGVSAARCHRIIERGGGRGVGGKKRVGWSSIFQACEGFEGFLFDRSCRVFDCVLEAEDKIGNGL